MWPERPTCHGASPPMAATSVVWRAPRVKEDDSDPYTASYRTCSYCGSIHPGDFYDLLTGPHPVTVGGSDWKYGWPHKFYVMGIPNLAAGAPMVTYTTTGVIVGRADASEWEEYTPKYNSAGGTGYRKVYSQGTCPTTMHAKWYNEHFLDLSAEAFALLHPLVAQQTAISFTTDEGRLKYSAPSYGYQS